jgi:CheY-like chemotaxis protein
MNGLERLVESRLSYGVVAPSQIAFKGAELGSFACRILVVSEHSEIAEHFAIGLREYGHQIFVASGEPRQLISYVGTCLPAVVLIETTAGVSGFLSGCSLASCIRALPFVPQPLIFICSSVDDSLCKHEAQVSGVDYFVKVPATSAQISQLLRASILRPRRILTTEKAAAV